MVIAFAVVSSFALVIVSMFSVIQNTGLVFVLFVGAKNARSVEVLCTVLAPMVAVFSVVVNCALMGNVVIVFRML